MAESSSVCLVATVDHVNAPLQWDKRLLARFNWCADVDVKGYDADVKGYDADVKGYDGYVKGYDADVKGDDGYVKGYDGDVKGYAVDVRFECLGESLLSLPCPQIVCVRAIGKGIHTLRP
eukprot:3920481-Pyramimonas_sp.AAC.1